MSIFDKLRGSSTTIEKCEQYMQKLQAEDALRNQYSQPNPYQQGLNQASHGLGQQYHASQTWTDPRTENRQVKVLIGAIEETNKVMKRLAERMVVQERRVEMLTGFYTWVTEVHPEITAQHKAMRELYEAANSGETQTEASS